MSLYMVEPVHTSTQTIYHEFHRKKDGTKFIKKEFKYKPYFFADEKAPIEGFSKVLKVKNGFTSVYDTPVKQVFVNQYYHIRELTETIKSMGYKTYEADLPCANRYMNDLPKIEKTQIYQCFLDIETNTKDKFPDIEAANHEITCLTTKLNGITYTWVFGAHINPEDLLEFSNTRLFRTETEMLRDFIEWIRVINPDVLTAWNINNFDLRYMFNRMRNLGIDYNMLSHMNKVYMKEIGRTTYCKIKGRIVFDQLEGYKLWRKYGNMPVLDSYSLNNVAKAVLGKEKLDHGKTMNDLWLNDIKTLIEYNRWDVELLDLIDKRCKLIHFFDDLRIKCRIQFDDVYKTTAMIDGYLIYKLNKRTILPNAMMHDNEKFKGAFVYQPKKGIYNFVLCLDVKGMYPNIIKTFNISPETFGGEIKLPIGTSFSRKPGIIPMFLDELAVERAGYKDEMNKATDKADIEYWYQKQYGTKVLANCFSHDTDIVTPSGIKNIKELKVGDLVYSINPDTKNLELKPITHTFEQYYDDDMIHFKNKTIDLMVTPNHRMLYETPCGKIGFINAENYKQHNHIPLHNPINTEHTNIINLMDYNDINDYNCFVRKNKDLRTFRIELSKLNINIKLKKLSNKWCGIPNDSDTIKQLHNKGYDIWCSPNRGANCKKMKMFVDTNDFSELLGWFISEGNIYKSKQKQYENYLRGVSNNIQITQYKACNKDNYNEICKLLDKLEIKYRAYDKSISFSSDMWANVLNLCGHGSRNKKIPDKFINIINKPLFFSALYKGDGNKNAPRYSTSSKKLAEQVCLLVTEFGYKFSISMDKDGCYRIYFYKSNTKPHKENINVVKNNSDKIYCVTVKDNHTVLAGRNNKFVWTGQSFFGYCGYPGSRLYMKEVASSITGMGEYIILEIIKWVEEKGYKIIYSDTDSVYIQAQYTDKLSVVQEGFNLTDHINKHLDTFSKNISGINTIEIEFEKALERILFTDAKKKYAYRLLWEDKKNFNVEKDIKVTGFSAKRSDNSKLSKETQLKVLNMIMDDTKKRDIVEYLKNKHKKMINRGYEDSFIGIPKGIKKELSEYNPPGPIIKGSLFSNLNYNTNFGKGSKPKFVWVKGLKNMKTKPVVMANDKLYVLTSIAYDNKIPDNILVDWNTMSESTFQKPLQNIFDAIGWNWESLDTQSLYDYCGDLKK